MPAPELLTYFDAVASAKDFLGGNSSSLGQADVRRCIKRAYAEVAFEAAGGSLIKRGRIQLVAPYSTGTIQYDHTGGTYEREVLLTDGVWPAACEDMVVLIGTVEHHIESRKSDTTVTLDAVMNPGANVDSGTSYSVYPRWYALPYDFKNFYGPWTEESWSQATEVSWDEMLGLARNDSSTGSIQKYCIREIAELHNSVGLYVHPPSDAAETLDYVYDRKPRQLRHTGHDTNDQVGTITADGTTAIVGTSTVFASTMVGSVLRISDSTTVVPTELGGTHSYSDERIILSVAGTGSLTVDANMDAASTKKYCITDVIDLPQHCWEAFNACVNKQLAAQQNMKNAGDYFQIYKEAISRAKAGRVRSRQRRVAGGSRRYVRRGFNVGDDIG